MKKYKFRLFNYRPYNVVIDNIRVKCNTGLT